MFSPPGKEVMYPYLGNFSKFFKYIFYIKPQSLAMHYIRDERGDEALTL